MSFSSEVKQELEQVLPSAAHCQIAEAAAIVRFGRRLKGRRQSGLTVAETESGARKLFTLLKQAYNIEVVVQPDAGDGYRIRLSDEERARAVRASFADYVPRLACCRKAFLRGAFLAAGSLSAPEKYYHFEIACPDEEGASLLRRVMKELGLDARQVLRKKDHVVYLKESDQIVEALGAMGASLSLLSVESIRVVKDVRGRVNRRVNCETANLKKTVLSAVRQTEDILYIRDKIGLGSLSPALREMAEIRLANPDAPLQELGEYADPRIGKSGVNHRLRKLSAIADALRGSGTE